ncbi:UDP-3-O-acyl-N-acetylglucosamine deacetylase [Dysgonomonas sp. 520]|uniref:UDP-3-O-acyl-N-acetylglucosamine deacetylase n=1 Tax=Dysgonomonas sp. 520 TaxID=2302931 RepID=UPI0013D05EF9|nr:UDP-3-O-acyl-N-acetylglucosamine deacetylase [Dysgonomonas sp. 520]NDW10560.1 UDP-3-O-[3-hydroxymyristoyl] N-acetylglucosamine deacetylase [Dysgonomonas sp. 520]
MVKQRTLKDSFYLKGKGLHTGLNLCITFNPAPENHGYKFRRIDLEGCPVIDALAENVCDTDRGTVLSANGAKISTVEHALAALYASEIDNCLIDVNGPEVPILDGSAFMYIEKIREVGTIEQAAKREYLCFNKSKIKVTDSSTGASISMLPCNGLHIESRITFESRFLKQQDACLFDLKEFAREFASSRTFVFVKEIEPLLKNNMIKGGDLDNSIVIYDEQLPQDDFDQLADAMGVKRKNSSLLGYIMNKPLIYPNEPARHKLLDIVGDLALIGKFIEGKIIAYRPGHKINTMFSKAIREYMKTEKKKVGVKSFSY